MPVIHRKTLAVWPFLANIENLTQRLRYTFSALFAKAKNTERGEREMGHNF